VASLAPHFRPFVPRRLSAGWIPTYNPLMFRLLSASLLVVLLALPAEAREFVAQPSDFTCLLDWPQVRKFRIFNSNPRKLKKALRIAERGKPGRHYPRGTIIQLVPFEAIVKRRGGYNREGGGWEFFALRPTAAGTEIVQRGGAEVVSFGLSGANCQNCHSAAKTFDFVCESGRGCVDINVTSQLIDVLTRGDPRCATP
jgi:hypothetical protein